MENERDPRVDPKPGDVLRTGHPYARVYCEVMSHDPRYASTDVIVWESGTGRERAHSLNQYRNWMRQAEVIHRAD